MENYQQYNNTDSDHELLYHDLLNIVINLGIVRLSEQIIVGYYTTLHAIKNESLYYIAEVAYTRAIRRQFTPLIIIHI